MRWWCLVDHVAHHGNEMCQRQLKPRHRLTWRLVRLRDIRSTSEQIAWLSLSLRSHIPSICRPPLVRSTSDTSLASTRSYRTVSRAPPRFSQVFQPSDFKHELPKRCGSFPHCHPTVPCHSPDPIPPPLPRRSIASTASSKPSRNSIYKRQPSRIEDETENHYNFII